MTRFEQVRLRRRLDRMAEAWRGPAGPVGTLPFLAELTGTLRRVEWAAGWREVVRDHPIARLVWQDPLTDWAFRHGPAGHAVLLDFLHDHPGLRPALAAATPGGQAVHLFTSGSEFAVALREGARLVAHALDAAVGRTGSAEVLAVGCGHLPELAWSHRAGEAARIVALSAEAEPLREAMARHAALGNVECVCAAPARLAERPRRHGRFDLIHALRGLDALEGAAAARFALALFEALKPGGRLILDSFAVDLRDEGYMDAFMDWRPAQRRERDLQELLRALPLAEVERAAILRGNNGAMLYALVDRRG